MSGLEQSSFVAYKNCLSTYTLKSHIDRHLRRDRSNQSTSTKLLSSERPRQLEVPMFKWLEQWFFFVEQNVILISIQSILINGESHTSAGHLTEEEEGCRSKKYFFRLVCLDLEFMNAETGWGWQFQAEFHY